MISSESIVIDCFSGVLGSHPRGRDVHINQFSVTFHGQEILSDADFEMNCGRRYGFVGLNGSGKSTILACIGNREVFSLDVSIDNFFFIRRYLFLNILIFFICHVKWHQSIRRH